MVKDQISGRHGGLDMQDKQVFLVLKSDIIQFGCFPDLLGGFKVLRFYLK